MQRNLPMLKRRLDRPAGYILMNILACSTLCVFGIDYAAAFVDLNDIRENRIDLFKCTWLSKDGGIVDPFKQRMPNAAVRNPERERPQRTAE